MKFIKILAVILVIGGVFVLLNKENETAVNNCMDAGNSKSYCEYHAG